MADNKPGEEAPKNAAPTAQSTKPVAAESITKPDPDAAKPVTKKEEAAIEKLLGDEPEYEDPEPTIPVAKSAELAKLRRLVSLVPRETPDDHSVWGAAGIKLTLGDLRAIARIDG